MMLHVFSVFDAKAELFSRPFFEGTRGMAIRAFSDAVNEEGTPFHSHAEDYTLYEVGTFDESNGVFESLSPVALGVAQTFLLTED